MTAPLEALTAALADRYAIERELGRGGMAVVYLAHDLRHDRPVALKLLHPEQAASLGADRFLREVRLAARLQHPHILTVLDSGAIAGASGSAGSLWFTMPFVDGETLRARLTRERQLAVGEAIRIAREARRRFSTLTAKASCTGTSSPRTSVEAVPGRSPTTRWQQSFEAGVTDVFQVQAEIATKVAAALDVALGSAQKQALSEKPTDNLAAYDAFLQGEAAISGTFAPQALQRAIELYERAVGLDSSFALAWAQLARAQSYSYFTVTPSAEMREASRRSVERARALAPDQAPTQLALGDYALNIEKDATDALAAYERGLRSAPANAELLTGAALAEQSVGRWDAALAHLARAQSVDPRGLTLAPGNLDMMENLVMSHLGEGNLTGARAALKANATAADPAELVAFFANFWDLFWVLDDTQQRLLLTLTPVAFADDRSAWGLCLAQTLWLRGDRVRARAYADSSAIAQRAILRSSPDDAQRHVVLGLALAYAGQRAGANAEGERGLALMPASKDRYVGTYLQHQLARIYLLTGETDKAMDQLQVLLGQPYYLSPAWIRIDPTFEPLRDEPRFKALLDAWD